MSKKNKNRKNKGGRRNYSTLQQHTKAGKKLLPPFLQIPKLQLGSWRDDRLPEMMWAALIVGNLDREQALDTFRAVANYISSLKQPAILDDITHTTLSNVPTDILKGFINVLIWRPDQARILRSLLLLENLPAYTTWKELLPDDGSPIDFIPLMNAVAKTLDHQSQEATDCRWMRVIAMMASGLFQLPSEEMAKEFAYYPNEGDMRKVRPSIRATEGALSSMDETKREWATKFWMECWQKSNCFPLRIASDDNPSLSGTTEDKVKIVYQELIKHFMATNITTAIDIKHDVVFGIAFYSLSILKELLRIGSTRSILARSGLRTLLELYVTLKYLVNKNDLELWKSFRVFGAGQAKLTFLKLDEDPSKPSSINLDTLNALANEDVWQEFLPINLGHWENSNLRKISIEAGVKDDYDRYYSWTSSYSHGHWGPIRETVFDICGNPLHRLHRIPLISAKPLPDVISDACYFSDKILDILNLVYPNFQHKVSITNAV